jgi:hypothetical protein
MDEHTVFLVRYNVFYMLGTSILVFKIVTYLKYLFAKEKVVMLDDYGNLKDNCVNSIQEPKVLPLIYENLSVQKSMFI